MTRPPADNRHAIQILRAHRPAGPRRGGGRTALVPRTFGEHGHFRFAAIEEARQIPTRHAGSAVCGDCHADIVELHDKDAHTGVACESCHGPGLAHAEAGGDGTIRRPDGRDACLVCHGLMLARPGEFPQVTPDEHLAFVGVADRELACVTCHDPHEPLFMDRDVRTARLHPLIHRCRDCHAGRLDEGQPRPAAHPAIFECDYCHAEVAADFAQLPHQRMRCNACHLFFRESEFGRPHPTRCRSALLLALPSGGGIQGSGRGAEHRLARTSRRDGSARRARPALRRLPPGSYPPSPAGKDGRTVSVGGIA